MVRLPAGWSNCFRVRWFQVCGSTGVSVGYSHGRSLSGKILGHTIFVKFTDHPVTLAQFEFHFVLADIDQECKML
jgi:hypothetical protein